MNDTGPAGQRGPMHPLAATHIDFGCLACGNILKTCLQSTALRKLVGQHKKASPDCFVGSAIVNDADCARALEQNQRANLAKFERNRHGDTDGMFDTTGDVPIVQCASCSRCFEKKTDADGHVRPGRTKCSGATLWPITGRATIFGTLCPAPSSTRRRTNSDASPAASTAAPAGLDLRTPAASRRPAAITPGTAATCAGTCTTTPASATTGTSTTTAISTVLNTPVAAATPAVSRPTPVSFMLPAVAATPAPRAAAFNPYLGISRVEQCMRQSTNPVVQRALQAARSSSFPPAESKWQIAVRIIKPFVPIGGDVEDYAHMHADLGRPDDIISKLTGITKLSDTSTNEEYTFIIDVLLASVDEYFINHAKDDVKRCWPNLRAMIQMTSATTDEEDNVHHGCFNFRCSAGGLLKLAKEFIIFLWRSSYHVDDWQMIMEFVQEKYAGDIDTAVALVVESGIIAEVLVAALLQPPSSAQHATVISVFATAQMFWYHKGKGEHRLCSAGGISKKMAALHNLVRVAACTRIAKMEGGDAFKAKAEESAMEIRSAVSSSWLAGQIRTWRDIEGRTSSKVPPTTVDEHGNICIGSEKILWSIISTLIPTINRRLDDFFGKIVSGDEWKDILDPTNEILMHRKVDGNIYFEILYQNGTKRSSNSYFLNSVDSAALKKYESTVAGSVYATFHGFGGGSCRGQELYRTIRHDLVMSGGKMFYETISMKMKSKYVKTLRCLPPCTTRRVSVALVLYSGGGDGELFDLNFDQVDDAVANTYSDVFGLTHRLCFQKSRQMYACISNHMKKMNPDRNYDCPGLEVADVAEAENFAHSLEMHTSRYPSLSPSNRDLTYRDWWRALGATGFENVAPVSGAIRPITDEQLLRSLQFVLGIPNASFREGQLEACRHVANSKTENALVGLDCGAGKSTTFTVPLYAKWRYQKIDGVTIVICPHRIALKQHYETARNELKSTDISIGILSAGDIDDEFTVSEIEKSDLLFLSMDGWCRITTDKLKGVVLDLRRKRGVAHVIFDEYHMLYDEDSIRKKAYLSSRHLLATGATITILTATLPNPFRRPVMGFLDIADSAIEDGCIRYSVERDWEFDDGFWRNKGKESDSESCLQMLKERVHWREEKEFEKKIKREKSEVKKVVRAKGMVNVWKEDGRLNKKVEKEAAFPEFEGSLKQQWEVSAKIHREKVQDHQRWWMRLPDHPVEPSNDSSRDSSSDSEALV